MSKRMRFTDKQIEEFLVNLEKQTGKKLLLYQRIVFKAFLKGLRVEVKEEIK